MLRSGKGVSARWHVPAMPGEDFGHATRPTVCAPLTRIPVQTPRILYRYIEYRKAEDEDPSHLVFRKASGIVRRLFSVVFLVLGLGVDLGALVAICIAFQADTKWYWLVGILLFIVGVWGLLGFALTFAGLRGLLEHSSRLFDTRAGTVTLCWGWLGFARRTPHSLDGFNRVLVRPERWLSDPSPDGSIYVTVYVVCLAGAGRSELELFVELSQESAQDIAEEVSKFLELPIEAQDLAGPSAGET
jgi:hypothetical protein